LIPRKLRDKVQTDRCDAMMLAPSLHQKMAALVWAMEDNLLLMIAGRARAQNLAGRFRFASQDVARAGRGGCGGADTTDIAGRDACHHKIDTGIRNPSNGIAEAVAVTPSRRRRDRWKTWPTRAA
jgi:hypothetical protein